MYHIQSRRCRFMLLVRNPAGIQAAVFLAVARTQKAVLVQRRVEGQTQAGLASAVEDLLEPADTRPSAVHRRREAG